MAEITERNLHETTRPPEATPEILTEEESEYQILQDAQASATNFRESIVGDIRGPDPTTPTGIATSGELKKLLAEAYLSLARLRERVGSTAQTFSTEITRRKIEKRLTKLDQLTYKFTREQGHSESMVPIRDKVLILLDKAAGIQDNESIRYSADTILSKVVNSFVKNGNIGEALATWENVSTLTYQGSFTIGELDSAIKKLPDEKREETFRRHPDLRLYRATRTSDPQDIISAMEHVSVIGPKSSSVLSEVSVGRYRQIPATDLYTHPETRSKLFEVYQKNGKQNHISGSLEIFADRLSTLEKEDRTKLLELANAS